MFGASGSFPDRYSNELTVWVKASACLSSHKSKRQSGAFSVNLLDIRPSASSLLAMKQMKSQLVLTEAIPSPSLRGFYIGVSCIRGLLSGRAVSGNSTPTRVEGQAFEGGTKAVCVRVCVSFIVKQWRL